MAKCGSCGKSRAQTRATVNRAASMQQKKSQQNLRVYGKLVTSTPPKK